MPPHLQFANFGSKCFKIPQRINLIRLRHPSTFSLKACKFRNEWAFCGSSKGTSEKHKKSPAWFRRGSNVLWWMSTIMNLSFLKHGEAGSFVFYDHVAVGKGIEGVLLFFTSEVINLL